MKSLRQKHKWIILVITVMCPFMATVDTSIVNVALPVLSQKLHVDSSRITWVATIYLLGQVTTMLLFGRLGDRKGQSRVFQGGVALFTVGSFLCSISTTFPMLIGARIVQSLGASATLSNTHAIITSTFQAKERGRALGINGAFVAFGYLIGPSLGGLILSMTDWHFMFAINLPVGVCVFIAGLLFLPEEHGNAGKSDMVGSTLFALSMLLFFTALQEMGNLGWHNPFILTSYAVSAVLLLFFLIWQKHVKQPLLDLTIFKNKWFSVSIFCAFASYMSISSYNLLQPFYLQDLRGMSPYLSGLFMSIYPFCIVLVSPLSGYLSDYIGSKKLTFSGLFLTCAGLALMTIPNRHTSLVMIACFVIIMSIGNGLFQSPNNVIVMTSVSQEHLGIAGSLNALARTTGQSAGIAITNALLYGGMSLHLGYHVTDFAAGQEDAFLFGMRNAYAAATLVCLLGLAATVIRLCSRAQRP